MTIFSLLTIVIPYRFSFARRGSWLKHIEEPGDCPVCKRTAIKVMYEQSLDGAKTMVCKQCNAALKHAK
ncbi:MAG: hypothetical protein CVV46_13420 [Spirochaetae bacterium HGW-Spirochaetae-2]|nr:MAG: hypothetical protein CVV46_13420 [Spirochaetae bacterium HGW-Spirochaetae-2]